ncbi:HXXEE domain-containing protein [Lysinibacillus sp. NPDC097195]|uniref:HXXEE domain-containing protein n=1 Tax=Lysinibacillus sp. NPDC097195 TaxID=3364141 RepID=UPI0037F45AAB
MEFWLNIQTLIWLFPIFFIIHDFEEIIMVEKWLHNNRNKLYNRLPLKLANRIVKQFSMTTAQFAVAVFIVFIVVCGATIAAILYLYNGMSINLYVFIVVTLVFFIHAFTHIGQSIIVRSITPGSVTSLIIIIPYCILLFSTMFKQDIITWQMILISLPFGLLFFPIVLLAHWIGKKVI